MVFQPHRYSRIRLFTEVLKDEFGKAFDQADMVTFLDVYPAGETPVPGVTGKSFMQPLYDNPTHPADLNYVDRRMQVVPFLLEKLDRSILSEAGRFDHHDGRWRRYLCWP